MSDRQLQPHDIRQGADEKIARSVTVTSWGTTPTDVTVKTYDLSGATPTDVSATVHTGAPSVAGDVITTPLIGGLVAGRAYRVEIKFTASNGNTFEPFFIIAAEA